MAAALCGPCCLFPALVKEPQGRKYLRGFKEKSHVGSPLQLSGMALELKRRCSSELPLQAASSSDRERISWESPISTEGDYSANPMEKWFGRGGGDEHGDDIEDGDMLREECGVVGIFGDLEASRLCYLSLHALQHRGQEGAGIVACDEGSLNSVTGMGLVSEVFNQTTLSKLTGSSAVGHVRYATAGESALKNVQPFVAGYRFGSVGVAHNGNLVNYNELRAMLEEDGSIFNTSSDTEVVLHLIAMSKARPFIARLVDACQQLEGAYSIVFLTEDKLVAVRDPYGFRPLVMGRRSNGAVVFASETCALDLIEATYEREINPGEVVVVDDEGISSLCLMPQRQRKACVFEHIYFALPNSIVFGLSVYQSRYRIGEILALETPVECDVVIAVPDSGVVAALGYAAMAGVPFQQGLIRSHYVGRTFIEPSQKIRDFGVKLKLAPVKAVLNGKRVVVVDDSIVRGTTSSKIVRLIKEAGATEVHLRIASPPITGSCYYGVDTPSKEELISFRLNVEETRVYVGADSLAFLPLERLSGMLGADSPNFCYACFTGDYPVPPKTLSKDAVEKETAHKVLVEGLTDSWKGANSKNPPKSLQDQSKGSGVSDVRGDTSSVSWDSQPRQVDTSPTLVESPQRIRSPTFYQTFAAGVPSETVTPVQAVSAPPRQAFMPGSPRQLPLSVSGPGATAAVQSPLFTSNPATVAPLTPSPTVEKVDKMNVSGGFDHIQMG